MKRGLVVAAALGALAFAAHELWLSRGMALRPAAARVVVTSSGPAPSSPSPSTQGRRARSPEARRPAELPPGRAPLSEPLTHEAFMRHFADDTCSCADQACATQVNRYFAEHLGMITRDPDDAARAHDEEVRAIRCAARLAHD